MSTSLATIESVNAITSVELFKPGTILSVVETIERLARDKAANLDVSTIEGQKAFASVAYQVARSKSYIDDSGKDLGEEYREKLNAINADRKIARERLDALKDEVRKPLTDLENADKARKAAHEAALTEIQAAGTFTTDNWQRLTSEAIADRIAEIEGHTRNWEEFAVRAAGVKAVALAAMQKAFSYAQKAEAERAELERLRAEAAERAIKEREEAAAKAATEAAERKAREAAEAAQRAAQAEQQRIENERLQAEAKAKQAEAQKIEAEKRLEAEKQAAARRAEQAAEQAKRNQERAIEAERERVAAEERRVKAEAETRERNKKHRAAINRTAKQDLIDHAQLPADVAETVIAAIAKGLIANVTITY